MTYPPYLNARPAPSRIPGLAGKLLILALFGAVTFVAVGGAKLIPPASALSITPSPSNTATIRPVAPELSNLAITQAALDVEGTELAYHGTALANLAVEAQVTQQAAIFRTQLARDAIHQAMTETTEAQHAARLAQYAQDTQTVLDANAQIRARATQTAEAWQGIAAVATQTAIAGEWEIAQRKRITAYNWAGMETVAWRIFIPLAVAGIVFMVARAFSVMLTRRYGTPVEVQPEQYQPGIFVEPDNQPEENEIPYTKIMVPAKDGHSGNWVDVKIYPEKLHDYAIGIIVSKKAVAEKYWTGSNNPFSIPEYRAFRDSMILVGLARWINPAFHDQGFSLSQEGWLALSLRAKPFHPPSAVPVTV